MVTPIFKPRSKFLNRYLKVDVVEMLEEHGFLVAETENDLEDTIYFEKHEEMIFKTLGLSNVKFNVKREFVAEYQLSEKTSIFVEGRYRRNLSGDKQYNMFGYLFYKRGFLKKSERIINERLYCSGVNKVQFLKLFEEKRKIFMKDEEE
ncbi:hypothetical protein ACYSNR_09205 [Enterococcus sp. LJL128]